MRRKILVITAIISFLFSCTQNFNKENFFYIERDGAVMPVWVRGNIDSKVMVIILHGGPGGTSVLYLPDYLKELENDYGFVYWDQRGAGSSQGNGGSNNVNIYLESINEDLSLLIDIVKAKYDVNKIFLFGHSWGGAVGTSFLLDKSRQGKVDGWIELDGGHNGKRDLPLSVQYVKDYANKKISECEKIEYWQKCLNWYDTNPVLTNGYTYVFEHEEYVNACNGIFLDPEVKKKVWDSTSQYISSPFNLISSSCNSLNAVLNVPFISLDLTYEMGNITLPTLILWGRYDGIIPVKIGEQAYEKIGTPINDKKLIIYENSAHNAVFEEPDKFNQDVKAFINKYK